MANPFEVTPSVPGIPIAPTVGKPANPSTTGTNDGSTVTMPNVAADPPPRMEGEARVDRGDDAMYEVGHHMILAPKGEFKQGDRIGADDLDSPGVDIERMIKLGAIKPIEKKAAKEVKEPEPEHDLRGKGKK